MYRKCQGSSTQASLLKKTHTEDKYVHRVNAIMHALEIERSPSPLEGQLNTHESCASIEDLMFFQEHIKDQISKPMSQTTDCSKEGVSSIRDHKGFKMENISFVTPIPEGSHKSCKNLLPPLYEGTMECQSQASDVVRLDARVEGAGCKPTGLQNDTQLCDVELTVHGNYEGHGLPLAFLTSISTGKPVKGYPVTVEVLEDGCSAASIAAHQLAALSAYTSRN
ncbi:uncharacterized protein C2845_PM07G12700 [Panicum miliaceum]|uniref:Uncharacterized protein n=1 Tax=Panicum miliaceum TaxID=4540 RepID=A0A3L6SPK0_PANMI|nr:uncharacterized protein C2845_PM07G12700 [Panicum miliaceum]